MGLPVAEFLIVPETLEFLHEGLHTQVSVSPPTPPRTAQTYEEDVFDTPEREPS